jgi:hypothetical protein
VFLLKQGEAQLKKRKRKYPQFIMGLLALAKNGDEQFWKGKFHAANGKAQHALIFFFLSPFVSNMFLQVPNQFPICSEGSQ